MAPTNSLRMSVDVAGPVSPTLSFIEVKEETRLVLKSFLRHALSIPPADRPGRIGGAYRDPNKYSILHKVTQGKDESGWDSLDEKISAAEEKKHGIKNLIKRRLKPRPSHARHPQNLGNDQSQNGSVTGQGEPPALLSRPEASGSQGLAEDEKSSASDEEGERKTGDRKKKKSKRKLPGFFKKIGGKKDDVHPQRPTSLPVKEQVASVTPPLSPIHPPEFYDGVAKTLNRIAQQSVRRKSQVKPEPIQLKDNKEAMIQQLVHLLTAEGDAMNEKINANPLLRKSLNRMSYASFAKLLDSCANEAVDPPLPVAESPTLRRVAITMEMTRRVVTATGATHRMEGFAERYMENFTPWVKSQGGWESIVKMGEEFD